MTAARDETALFQQGEHGAHRAGVGRHASCQFALRERRASRQRCQQHELISGDTVLGELHIGLAVKAVIGGPERQWKLVRLIHAGDFERETVCIRTSIAGGGMASRIAGMSTAIENSPTRAEMAVSPLDVRLQLSV